MNNYTSHAYPLFTAIKTSTSAVGKTNKKTIQGCLQDSGQQCLKHLLTLLSGLKANIPSTGVPFSSTTVGIGDHSVSSSSRSW